MSLELGAIAIAGFLLLATIILTCIWRLIVVFILNLIRLGRTTFTLQWGIILTIAFLIFGGGLLVQQFQEEVMQGLDIAWECLVTRVAQAIASVGFFLLRTPYEFLAENWNNAVVFVIDGFLEIIDDISMLIKLGKITSGSVITQDILGDLTSEFWTTISIIATIIEGFFVNLGELLACLVDAFLTFLTALITTRTFINQDCTYCALDPDPSVCTLRDKFDAFGVVGTEPNCDECFDLLADTLECTALFIDYLTLGLLEGANTNLPRIFRALACVINSALKPPFWILQGLIDNVVTGSGCVKFEDLSPLPGSGSIIEQWFTSEECGKSVCLIPPPSPPNKDLPIGVIPCWVELIRAVTGDEIDGFFELIASFILDFITIIIVSIENIVVCFDSPALVSCLEGYPQSGAGICLYNTGDSGFEVFVPDGGIFKCWEPIGTCLDNSTAIPLLEPLGSGGIDFISFIFGDFWRFTVDFAACPFFTLQACFPTGLIIPGCPEGAFPEPPFDLFNDVICATKCIENGGGPLSFLAGILSGLVDDIASIFTFLLNFRDDVLEAIEALFCIVECPLEILDCLEGIDCAKKREIGTDNQYLFNLHKEEQVQEWRKYLLEKNISNHTTCGRILHSEHPFVMNNNGTEHWGDHMVYWTCFSMLSASVKWQKKECHTPLNGTDFSGLLDFSSFPQCVNSMFECSREDYVRNLDQNSNETVVRERNANLNVTISPSSFGKVVSVVADYQQGISNGTVKWSLVSDILIPTWNRFTETKYYELTIEFGRDLKQRKDYYKKMVKEQLDVHNDSLMLTYRNVEEIKKREELDLRNRYMDYVNSMLFYHRTKPPLPYRTKRNTTPSSLISDGQYPNNSLSSSSELSLAENSNYRPESPVIVYDDTRYPSKMFYLGYDGREYKILTEEDLLHKREIAKNIYSKGANATEKSKGSIKLIQQIWDVLYERYEIEYWPRYRVLHAIYTSFKNHETKKLFEWSRGEIEYLVSKGFVNQSEYESEMSMSRIEKRGSLLHIFSGNYNVREHKVYRPFPIRESYNMTQAAWIKPAAIKLQQLHEEKQAQRQRRKEQGLGRRINGQSALDFDANKIIYEFSDWVIGFILGIFGIITDNPVQNFVANTIIDFSDIDIQGSFLEDLEDVLLDYFVCEIPENFDGTDIYSPWCVTLLPENLYSAIALTPNDVFPLQIQWPEQLILVDCVNTYNGDNNLFNFSLSDGCQLVDNFTRPFCPFCDNCPRRYSDCLTATCLFPNGTRFELDTLCPSVGGTIINGVCELPNGNQVELGILCTTILGGEFESAFGDVLDTFLFFVAIIPRFLQEFYTGGISLKSVEQAFNLYIGLITLQFLVALPFPLGFIVFLLYAGLSHVVTWTAFQIFGDAIPFGFILLVLSIAFLIILALLGFFLLFLLIPLLLIVASWILSLIIQFPNFVELFDIIGFLIDVFDFLREFPLLFFWREEFTLLVARLQEFNYGTGPIPPLHTFCVVWNFSNLGYLLFVLFGGFFFLRLAWQSLIILIIFVFQLIWAFLDIRRKYRIWRLRGQVDQLQQQRNTTTDRVNKLRNRIKILELRGGIKSVYFDPNNNNSSNNNNNNKEEDDDEEAYYREDEEVGTPGTIGYMPPSPIIAQSSYRRSMSSKEEEDSGDEEDSHNNKESGMERSTATTTTTPTPTPTPTGWGILNFFVNNNNNNNNTIKKTKKKKNKKNKTNGIDKIE